MGNLPRILIAILLGPIGVILLVKGVSTKAMGITLGGLWVGLIVLLVVLAIVIDTDDETAIAKGPATLPTTSIPAEPSQIPPTPMPTETCPTAEEAQYFQEFGELLVLIGIQFTEMSAVFGMAAGNPLLFLEETWQKQVSDGLGDIEISAHKLETLSSPRSTNYIHQHFLTLAAYILSATDHYRLGVETLDADSLDYANEEIALATEVIALIEEQTLDFCDKQGR